MGSNDAPVLLTGVSSTDQDDIQRLIEQALRWDLDGLYLPKNFSGDVVFETRIRFVGGVLKTTDSSLQRRRRRLYGKDG